MANVLDVQCAVPAENSSALHASCHERFSRFLAATQLYYLGMQLASSRLRLLIMLGMPFRM